MAVMKTVRVDKSKMGKENDKKINLFKRLCISVILSFPIAGKIFFVFDFTHFFSVGIALGK